MAGNAARAHSMSQSLGRDWSRPARTGSTTSHSDLPAANASLAG
jgi:hypothetical protein